MVGGVAMALADPAVEVSPEEASEILTASEDLASCVQAPLGGLNAQVLSGFDGLPRCLLLFESERMLSWHHNLLQTSQHGCQDSQEALAEDAPPLNLKQCLWKPAEALQELLCLWRSLE